MVVDFARVVASWQLVDAIWIRNPAAVTSYPVESRIGPTARGSGATLLPKGGSSIRWGARGE
jgi:hypothetical protein